jgi:putative transposase
MMTTNNLPEQVAAKHAVHKISVGALVNFEGETYEVIALLDHVEVTAKNTATNRHRTLRIDSISPVNMEEVKNHELSDIGDAQWQEAQRRFAIIQPLLGSNVGRRKIEEAAKENGVFFTTLYRWIAKYKETGSCTNLVDLKRGRKTGHLSIASEVEAVIKDAIDSVYLTVHRPSIKHTINEVLIQCRKRGLIAPHDSTIRRRIAQLTEYDMLRARGQRKKARDMYRPASGSFPGADSPLAVIQIDHTPLDVMVVDDEYRQSIGRPYLTLAMDIYSRMITGYYLSLDEPSAVSVAMCIAQSILPKHELLMGMGVSHDWPVMGIPSKIHMDNAAEFKSETLQRACATYNITTEYRMPGMPQTGGHIERVIGTILKETHNLPGTTFSNIKERDNYQPEKHAIMTLSEVEKWLVSFITGVYHQSIHSELKMSPLKQWEIGIFGDGKLTVGSGLPPLPANHHTLLISFLPLYHRSVQTQGVSIDGLHYYADVLRQWIKSKDPFDGNKARKFMFRRDPRNISIVWFFDPLTEQYYRIPCSDQRIPAISHWEYQNAIKHIKEAGINSVNPDRILDALEDLRTQAEASAHKTKQARRLLQRSKEAEKSRKNDAPAVNEETGEAISHQSAPALTYAPSTIDNDLWGDLDDLKPFHIE